MVVIAAAVLVLGRRDRLIRRLRLIAVAASSNCTCNLGPATASTADAVALEFADGAFAVRDPVDRRVDPDRGFAALSGGLRVLALEHVRLRRDVCRDPAGGEVGVDRV